MKKLIFISFITAGLLQAEFIRIDDLDVVADTNTFLVWHDNEDVVTIRKNWQEANDYCSNLNFAGYDDWYLPTKKELKSIVDMDRIPSIVSKFQNAEKSWYSTSTPSKNDGDDSWNISFANGDEREYAKTDDSLIRCVRLGDFSDTNSFLSSLSSEISEKYHDYFEIMEELKKGGFEKVTTWEQRVNDFFKLVSIEVTLLKYDLDSEKLTYKMDLSDYFLGILNRSTTLSTELAQALYKENATLSAKITLKTEITENEKVKVIFGDIVEIDDNNLINYDIYNSTVSETQFTTLETTRETFYFRNNTDEDERKIQISGGTLPYSWSSSYGSFEFQNQTKTIAIYNPSSVVKKDDVITIKDSSEPQQIITVNAKYVRDLEITPSNRYIVRDEQTIFKIVGGYAPFNVVVVDGDADIIDDNKNDDTVIIKASKIASTVHIKFSDSAGQEIVKEINVADKLRATPLTAYFNDFSEELKITITGGVAPYTTVATSGDVEVKDNIATYKADDRYVDQQITISDASGQETIVDILVDNAGGLKASPTAPVVDLSSTTTFKAISGTGNYEWSVEKGALNAYSGESVDYIAPNFKTTDKLTITDSSGAIFTVIISVGNDENINTNINLTKGWNLVSIPIDIGLTYVDENSFPPVGYENINILGNFDSIWIFNKKWFSNDEINFKIDRGVGFWIKTDNTKTVIFEGKSYTPELANLPNGWSLLGTGEKINNINSLFNFKIVWTYKDKWIKNPETIDIGQGFWINK